MSTVHSPAPTSNDRGAGPARIRTALLSVHDKTGVVDLARAVARHGGSLLASGGTARALDEAGLNVLSIEEYAGLAPGFGGRVKTLHPKVHAGILARRDVPADLEELERAGGRPIDLVCVHLYPFEETVAAGAPPAERVEQIDVGGPTMLRAAAKNWEHVAVICDPADVAGVIAEMDGTGGALSRETRRRLAAKAFGRTAAYDAAIAEDLAGGDPLPATVATALYKVTDLRYGENPHQAAALYAPGPVAAGSLPGGWRQVGGGELTFNNWIDLVAAAELALAFDDPCAVIVKHTNPCGVALAPTPAEAWERSLACDPVSAFGGIAAFNRPLDADTAAAARTHFLEVIAAPSIPEAARSVLARKKRLRLVEVPGEVFRTPRREWRNLPGAGFLLQEHARIASASSSSWQVVSGRGPTDEERRDLEFAWRVVAAVKSNAVIFARDRRVLGVGAGQMSRVDSVRIAVEKARELGHDLAGSVLASDAFFPFADGPRIALAAGARAIVQPGGSKRDSETVEAVDEAGAAMLFTGCRVFRH